MKKFISLFVVAAVLTVCLFTAFGNAPVAEAQIAVPQTGALLTFASNTAVAVTGTTYGPVVNIAAWDDTETQYIVDQDALTQTLPNTITISLDYSNDRTTWSSTALVTDNAADANGWLTPSLTGAYGRLKMVASNASPVTVTVIALGKNDPDVSVTTPAANVTFSPTVIISETTP